MTHDRQPSAPASVDHQLIVSCPNTGGLLALGPDGGRILDFEDTVGLFAEGRVFARAYQTSDGAVIDLFIDDEYRRLKLPAVQDMHDVYIDGDRLLAVSTGSNAVVVHALDGTPLERITLQSAAGDCWHVNCLGKVGGRLVLSAFGRFAEHRGWTGGRSRDHGFVMGLDDNPNQPPVFTHLDQPHTPREHQGWLYVCDSRNQQIVRTHGDLRETLRIPPWFTRGLAFAGDTLYVGLSASRATHAYGARGALAVVDLTTFRVRRQIPLPFPEVYDIVAVSPATHGLLCRHYGKTRDSSAWDYAAQSIFLPSIKIQDFPQTAQLYWRGAKPFAEKNSISQHYLADEHVTLRFDLPQLGEGEPIRMRFDPARCPGSIRIHSLRIEDRDSGQLLWTHDERKTGTKSPKPGPWLLRLSDAGKTSSFCALNEDPYLILPPVVATGPLRLIAEFSFDHTSGAFLKAYRARPLQAIRDMLGALLRA